MIKILNDLNNCKQGFNIFNPVVNPLKVNERLQYILNFLNENNIYYELDYFNKLNANEVFTDNDVRYCNIYIYPCKADKRKNTVIVSTHYDVLNDEVYKNFNSVTQLLILCKKIKEMQNGILINKFLNKINNKPYNKSNIVIALTDAKETNNFNNSGGKRLVNAIKYGAMKKVKECIVVKAISHGKYVWKDTNIKLFKNAVFVHSNYNEASIYKKNNIESICIGNMSDEEFERLSKMKKIKIMSNVVKSEVNESDMEWFNNYLIENISNI